MAIVNPFTRVRLETRLGGAEGTFGDWSGSNVNVTTLVPSSARGTPLDWWIRGSVAGNISNGFRKANSPNLISVSVLNPTDGNPADPGHAGTPPSWTAGTIQWGDGPAGNVAGSTTSAHVLDGPAGTGGGYRIQVPASLFPDFLLLKAWSWDYPARRMKYAASLNNTPTNSADAFQLSYYEPSVGSDSMETDEWTSRRCISTEVLFCADGAGQTLTYDITRFYEYWVSLYAVALYRAAIPQSNRGGRIAPIATQRGRPAGA